MIQLAGCLIFDSDKRLLLIHRNKQDKKQWETPGGKLELGETAREAAIRESQEEIGVTPTIQDKIGETDFEERVQLFHYVWFKGDIGLQHIKFLEPDYFDRYDYFDWKDIAAMDAELSANMKRLVKAFFNNTISV
jgi:mutator protein MutT